MKNELCFVFHALTLVHHLFTGKYSKDFIDYSKTTDPEVLKLKEFEYKFLTSWNFAFQTAYFSLALIHDVLKRAGSFEKLDQRVQTLKGYLFTSLMFPGTLFVSVMFWSVFAINRELVLPVAADSIIPSWINHSVHTNIVVVLIIEMLLVNNQFIPKFKSAFIGLSFFTVMYDAMLILTYFQSGHWVYGVFHVFTWTERAIFIFFNYFVSVLVMKLGIYVQNMKSDTKKLVDRKVD